jgi:cytochrome P450/NADPH-cytochrome P450 reductase
MLNLLKNESTYRAAQHEVDSVIGRDPVRVEHLKKLEYLNAVLRETLRLTPTAPAMTKQIGPKFQGQATLCKGKYAIEPSDRIIALLGATQRDPKVYGDDANEFKPERMLGENFKKLPNAAWKVSRLVHKYNFNPNFN